jgi:hypothetical protein
MEEKANDIEMDIGTPSTQQSLFFELNAILTQIEG